MNSGLMLAKQALDPTEPSPALGILFCGMMSHPPLVEEDASQPG